MHDSDLKNDIPLQRLCSEIKLFDLCDLDQCKNKNGRFCNDPALLGCFEKIADDEVRLTGHYLSEDADDFEGDEADGYEVDEYEENSDDDMDDGWEDEE